MAWIPERPRPSRKLDSASARDLGRVDGVRGTRPMVLMGPKGRKRDRATAGRGSMRKREPSPAKVIARAVLWRIAVASPRANRSNAAGSGEG